jgi:hypothetical protein
MGDNAEFQVIFPEHVNQAVWPVRFDCWIY